MTKLRSSFFKLAKHQNFEYKPRYYNPEQEELDFRVKEIERDMGDEADVEKAKLSIANKFRDARRQSIVSKAGDNSKYRMRIIMILLVLAYICYYVLG